MFAGSNTVVFYLLLAQLSSCFVDEYGRVSPDCYWTGCGESCVDGTTQLAEFSEGANSDYAKRTTKSCLFNLWTMKLCCSNRVLKGNMTEKCEFDKDVDCKPPKRNLIADDSTKYLCCDYDFLNATLVSAM